MIQHNELLPIVQPLLQWYHINARDLPWRQDHDPYRVWISEIMLQQTRVEAVKAYYRRFMEQLPTVESLAKVPEEQLMKLWEGLGYYSRARNLHKAAQMIMDIYGGQLPDSYEELLKLPGIGEYTAGAIASIAFDLPVAAVDGNVMRILTRLTMDDADISDPKVKRRMTQALQRVYPDFDRGQFTQALMELGAIVCVPNGNPACSICPVHHLCCANSTGRQLDFPHKAQKKPRRQQDRTILLLCRGNTVALRKRQGKGLLAGLWEFPGVDGHLTEQQVQALIERWGMSAWRIGEPIRSKHIFTHIEWNMVGYLVECEGEGTDDTLVWVTQDQLRNDYAVPSAFKTYLNALQ